MILMCFVGNTKQNQKIGKEFQGKVPFGYTTLIRGSSVLLLPLCWKISAVFHFRSFAHRNPGLIIPFTGYLCRQVEYYVSRFNT